MIPGLRKIDHSLGKIRMDESSSQYNPFPSAFCSKP
jgi:hypothetical protein